MCTDTYMYMWEHTTAGLQYIHKLNTIYAPSGRRMNVFVSLLALSRKPPQGTEGVTVTEIFLQTLKSMLLRRRVVSLVSISCPCTTTLYLSTQFGDKGSHIKRDSILLNTRFCTRPIA